MILDECVEIVLNPRYIKYWEDKGYSIPREPDKWGRVKVRRDAKLKVKVLDLPKNSHALVYCKCIQCGDVRQIEYHQYREVCGNCNHGLRSGKDHHFYGVKMTIITVND